MKKNIAELQKKSIEEINKEINKLRQEISKLKIELKINPPKDTNLLIKKKKQLAVLLTVLTEKKLTS